MKENNSAPKAEGRSEDGNQKSETRSPGAELVFPIPVGEQDFLATLMQFMRSAKRSQDRDVARAARRWETAIEFRIRMTLQERGRAGKKRRHPAALQSGDGAVTSSRSALHNQPSVSPARD